jgi:hypothetical protein
VLALEMFGCEQGEGQALPVQVPARRRGGL